jgi:hypothetical protein
MEEVAMYMLLDGIFGTLCGSLGLLEAAAGEA